MNPAERPSQSEVPSPPPVNVAAGSGSAVIASEALLKGSREVLIQHAGEIYRLRLTRNGKLILHK